MRLTLLERPTPITTRAFRAKLEKRLEDLKGELTASITFEDLSPSGWARIDLTGEDSEIVAQLISNAMRLAHTTLQEIEVPDVYDAQIMGSNANGLKFDLGLDTQNVTCVVPARNLQAQLADGKTLPVSQLAECYCLYPGERISIRTSRKQGNQVEAWLSDRQTELISNRVTSGLDRIEAFDCFEDDTEAGIRKAHLARDIVAVEQVTLTLQSIVCKLGTDAVGLIPKLGRVLRKQKLHPFLPRRIVDRCRPW